MLSLPQLFYSVARAEKKRTGKHVAMVVNGGAVRAIGYAGPRTHETAVVNVLHNASVGKTRDCALYTTAKPTEMCIGMAWQSNVGSVFYLDAGHMKKIVPDDTGITSVLDVTDAADIDVVDRIDDSNWRAGRDVLEAFAVSDTDFNLWYDWFTYRGTRLTERVFRAKRQLAECRDTYAERIVDHNEGVMLGRISDGLAPDSRGPSDATQPQKDQLWMKITLALAGAALWRSPSNGARGDQLSGGHNVAALMVDSGDNIIGWGVNLCVLNSSLHAETSMLLAYMRKNALATGLPASARIFSTLAPCHMCAGLIATLGSNVVVTIAHTDPRISNSALDRTVNGCRQAMTTLLPIAHEPLVYVSEGWARARGDDEAARTFETRRTASAALYPPSATSADVTPFAAWMTGQRREHFEAWQRAKRRQLAIRSDPAWKRWLETHWTAYPGHTPTTSDWLSDHHRRSGIGGVTTYLRNSDRPATLFGYSLGQLRRLADGPYATVGERRVLERGIALLDRLKARAMIKATA